MKIQVLGSGCPNCKKLYELTKEAVGELKLKDEVEYITDISKIVEMGVMSSPVLAVDDKPVLVGQVPDIKTIKELINKNCPVEDNCCKNNGGCNCGGNC